VFIIWNYFRQEPEYGMGLMTRERALAVAGESQRWGLMFVPYMIGQIEN
jgi:hypothetical protein